MEWPRLLLLGKAIWKSQAPFFTETSPSTTPFKWDEDSDWSKHLHPHNYRAKGSFVSVPSLKPPPGWPKGIRTNPNTTPVASPKRTKDQGNIGLCITKIATISKEAFKVLNWSVEDINILVIELDLIYY